MFPINKLCIVLYNAIQRIDNKEPLFGDELVCAIRKIIDHFMDKQISREVALMFELILKSTQTLMRPLLKSVYP